MSTCDQWQAIENVLRNADVETHELLNFILSNDVTICGDIDAPEFDADASIDDHVHTQSASCIMQALSVSIVIYANYVYKHARVYGVTVSCEREGTCICHNEISETCNGDMPMPAHWQTELCEDCAYGYECKNV